ADGVQGLMGARQGVVAGHEDQREVDPVASAPLHGLERRFQRGVVGGADRETGTRGDHEAPANRSRWCSASPKVWASMVRRRKVWLIFSSSVMPMPPWSWTASWLTWRAVSAILIFAADTARRRSAGS